MRMYTKLKFNHSVNPDACHISPGGYEMSFGGWNLQFDFEDYSGNVDSNDDTIVTFEARHLDTSAFWDSQNIDNIAMLKQLDAIYEFYVDIDGDSSLQLESILSITFETSDGETYIVPNDIISEYNERIAV